MNISSDRVSFTWLDGSEVNLTCTVELSQKLDVTVTLNIEWIGPAGFIANNTAEISNSNDEIYNSTISLNTFRREQAGDYNCTATVSSSSSFLRSSSHYSTKKINYCELIPIIIMTLKIYIYITKYFIITLLYSFCRNNRRRILSSRSRRKLHSIL